MESGKEYRCLYPCRASFDTSRKLAQHYSNRSECKQNWKKYHDDAARAAYESIIHGHLAAKRADAMEYDEDTASNSPISATSGSQDQMTYNWDTQSVSNEPFRVDPASSSPNQSLQDQTQEVSDNETPIPAHIEPLSCTDVVDESDPNVENLAAEFDAWWFNETQSEPIPIGGPFGECIASDHEEEETSSEQSEHSAMDEPQDEPEDFPHDEEMDNSQDEPLEVENYERAGEIKANDTPHFANLVKKQLQKGNSNLFFPFESAAEFEMVAWLNDLPLSKIDSFLHTEFVRFFFSFYDHQSLTFANLGEKCWFSFLWKR
jgi:hypothetical protein